MGLARLLRDDPPKVTVRLKRRHGHFTCPEGIFIFIIHGDSNSRRVRDRLLRLICLFIVAVELASVSPAPLSGQIRTDSARRIPYRNEPTSFGELRLPSGQGPFPVAVLVHGGCFLANRGSFADMRPIAEVLASRGIASWSVEYRAVGDPGGGWPGSYRDVADATDFLRTLAASYPLDLSRVILVGHSAGGYFVSWLAGRHHLPTDSPLTGTPAISAIGLVVLDAFLDYRVFDSRGVDGRLFCGEPILPALFGGDPRSRPDHVRQASPLALLPFGIPQEYVVSSLRYPVTPLRPLAGGRTTLAILDYPALARAAGDSIAVQVVPDADHFDFLKPTSAAWPAVEAAIVRVLRRP